MSCPLGAVTLQGTQPSQGEDQRGPPGQRKHSVLKSRLLNSTAVKFIAMPLSVFHTEMIESLRKAVINKMLTVSLQIIFPFSPLSFPWFLGKSHRPVVSEHF